MNLYDEIKQIKKVCQIVRQHESSKADSDEL